MKFTIILNEKEMDVVKDSIREMEFIDEDKIDILNHEVIHSYGPVNLFYDQGSLSVDIREDLSTIILNGFLSTIRHIKGMIIALVGIFESLSKEAGALFEGEKKTTAIDRVNADEYFERINNEKCSDKI